MKKKMNSCKGVRTGESNIERRKFKDFEVNKKNEGREWIYIPGSGKVNGGNDDGSGFYPNII